MAKFCRNAIAVAAILAIVLSASIGAAKSPPPIRCQGVRAAAGRMTHALWAILHHDVTARYPLARQHPIWRRLTSDPAGAYRLVNRLSHARVVAATCRARLLAAKHVTRPSSFGSTAAPSGQSMPTGDIPGWHQVFADNFSQNVPLGSFPGAVASKWGHSYADGLRDTSKNGTYMPSKVVSIANGVMNLYLHTKNGVHMVAAPVPTIPGATGSNGGMLYGRYVFRFRADAVLGYKLAMLLWPDSGVWPRNGEIDFPEANLTSNIYAVVHYQGGTSGTDAAVIPSPYTPTAWHTATITWLPSGLTFQIDGTTVGRSTTRIPNTPMHMVIQAETWTSGPAPTAAASGNVQFDWLTVYRPA
jgi:beta-glucanase (GH16 family)